MTGFSLHGPLEAGSPLYVGRETELEFLLNICKRKVSFYTTVFGSRQTGKTSLLLRLRNCLPKTTASCWLNFQSIPGASTPQMLDYLKCEIASATRETGRPAPDWQPSLTDFSDWLKAHMPKEPGYLVLCLDELGALPLDTRIDLANLLRSFHHRRLEKDYTCFYRLVVILFGGIELFKLAATKVSTLQSVCETVYLSELDEDQTIQLLGVGLKDCKLKKPQVEWLGRTVYAHLEGHPYLTQRAGAFIEKELSVGRGLTSSLITNAMEFLLEEDAYFTNLRESLLSYSLFPALKDMLERTPLYRRGSYAGLQLELLGAIKSLNHRPVARCPLLLSVLQDWFADPQLLALVRQMDPDAANGKHVEKEYTIYVNGSDVVFGDGNEIAQANSVPGKEKPMDPITLIASALVSGLTAGITETGKSALADAYGAFRKLLVKKAGRSPDAQNALKGVVDHPESAARRGVLEEELARVGAGQDKELLDLAKQILEILKESQGRGQSRVEINHSQGVVFGDQAKVQIYNNQSNPKAKKKK